MRRYISDNFWIVWLDFMSLEFSIVHFLVGQISESAGHRATAFFSQGIFRAPILSSLRFLCMRDGQNFSNFHGYWLYYTCFWQFDDPRSEFLNLWSILSVCLVVIFACSLLLISIANEIFDSWSGFLVFEIGFELVLTF